MLFCAAAQAQTVEVIPSSGLWVTDRAGLLSPTEEDALTRKLRTYADTTSTQIVIVTLPDLGGASAAEYATELGQSWGIGQGDVDNGVVLLVSRDDREVFIATGYGLEGAIPDAVASRIVRHVLVPSFRQGQFYAGLDRAVDVLVEVAAGEYTAENLPIADTGDSGIDYTTIFILLIIAYFVITSIRRPGGGSGGRRYRRRGGPPVIIWGGGGFSGGSGGGGFGGGGFGGFGGGGFGGGGAGGSW